MKNILSMLLMVASALLLGCGGSEPKAAEGEAITTAGQAIDYDKMAEGFCTCMRPMFEFQEKVMKLAEEGKNDEIEVLRDQAMQVQKDGESCITALEARFGVVEGAEAEAKATAALEKACPDIMGMMGAAAGSFEE